jgi:SAM-dependent methyltransferase
VSSGSVSFDRAADYYDQTRSIAPEIWTEVMRRLAAEVGGRGLVLEPGVGTGRAAIPLTEAGVQVVGVDISAAMMAKLRAQNARVPLAAADATRLPFADGTFGAAYLIHVLHLIPAWREAVTDIARVVRRPGVVLVDPGFGGQRGIPVRITRRFAREAGSTITKLMPGVTKVEELDAAMADLGATKREIPVVGITRKRSIRSSVEEMASGRQSFTWSLDEATLRRAGERTLEWASTTFGGLDTVRRFRWRIAWRAYDLA